MIHDGTKLPFTHLWTFPYDLSWLNYIRLLRECALVWSRRTMQDGYDFLCSVPSHLILPGSCKIEAHNTKNWSSEICIDGRKYIFSWYEHPNHHVHSGMWLAKQDWSALRIPGFVYHIYVKRCLFHMRLVWIFKWNNFITESCINYLIVISIYVFFGRAKRQPMALHRQQLLRSCSVKVKAGLGFLEPTTVVNRLLLFPTVLHGCNCLSMSQFNTVLAIYWHAPISLDSL